jgi:hypothetical protein
MNEYAAHDLVRVVREGDPNQGRVGEVMFVAPHVTLALEVMIERNGLPVLFAYSPDEVELVGAVLTPGRTVTVQL